MYAAECAGGVRQRRDGDRDATDGPDVTASDTAPVTTKALATKKVVKKKPKVVSHKKPKATG